jgi:hypothetical protein
MGDGTIVKLYMKGLHRSNAEQVRDEARYSKERLEKSLIAMAASSGQTIDGVPWHDYVAYEVPQLLEQYADDCRKDYMATDLVEFPEDGDDDYDPQNMSWVRERLEEAYTLMVCNCTDATCDKCKVSKMLRFIAEDSNEQ